MTRVRSTGHARSAAVAALLLVGATTSVGTAGAAVAAPSAPRCGGERATVVGAPDRAQLRGTPRRDVIVTNGSARVDARGGDDLVCVTGPTGTRTRVVAGGGDDRVRVTGSREVRADLGAGRDRYDGSGGPDSVVTSQKDPGGDRITTAGGDDQVLLALTRGTRVDLGGGDDRLSFDREPGRPPVTRNDLRGGAGTDQLFFTVRLGGATRGTTVVDNRRGTVVVSGHRLARHRGFEDFDLRGDYARRYVFTGGDADERVGFRGGATVSARMGAGDDTIEPAATSTVKGVLSGGAGQDTLRAIGVAEEGSYFEFGARGVSVDLAAGRFAFEDAGGTDRDYRGRISGIEGVLVFSPRATVTGSAGADRLDVAGCEVSVAALGGDDVLTATSTYPPDFADGNPGACLEKRPQRYDGGDGDDSLVGDARDNTLVGGAGADSADGGAGTDTCTAETVVRCEG